MYTGETCQRFDGERGKNKAHWYIIGRYNGVNEDLKSVNKQTQSDII